MGYLDNIKRAPVNGANGGGNYMKLQQGENKFRIVGSIDDGGFITGMLGWIEEDGKRIPIRWECDSEAPRSFADKPKEFFAFKVYNYAEERVQVLEITQVKLKNDLTSYCDDSEWGDPRKYDISIMRSGEGLETSYAMVPKPHKKMTEEQRKLVLNTSVNLKALYTGDDPFAEQADKGEEPF
jgi:hypothetical protein